MGSAQNIQRPLQVIGAVQIEKRAGFFRAIGQTALPLKWHDPVEPAAVKGKRIFKPGQRRCFVYGGKSLGSAAGSIYIERD